MNMDDLKSELSDAANDGDLETVKKILSKPIHPDINDEDEGLTPLEWAADDGHLDVVEYLLQQGADLHHKDKEGRTSLMWAISGCNDNIIKLFIEKGVDVFAQTTKGESAITMAANRGQLNTVQRLLEAGVPIDTKDAEGNTPLMLALPYHTDLMEYLVENGADVFTQNNKKESPLDKARGSGEAISYIKNAQKYKKNNKKQIEEKLKTLSPDELIKQVISNTEELKKFIVLEQLLPLFKRLPYSHQLPLYKVTRTKMAPSLRKEVENIIRNKRLEQEKRRED